MEYTCIPTKIVGPVVINGPDCQSEVMVPLTTYETPLWASVGRGAKISRLVDLGIHSRVVSDKMTRSVLLQAPNVSDVLKILEDVNSNKQIIENVICSTSRHIVNFSFDYQIVGNLLFVRLGAVTGEASGHNIITKAADEFIRWVLSRHSYAKYVSVSGNYCVDKKVSAVNSILGRGKKVIAEIVVPFDVCVKHLKVSPRVLVEVNMKKNLVGSIISGGVCSANAHFANMLLAIYLSTGQDAANIVEGSQGITYAELAGKDLYFSVTVSNIVVGVVGNGKHFDFAKRNLKLLGCDMLSNNCKNFTDNTSIHSRRLAAITASVVLCGELSLLAAQSNIGELMQSHIQFERNAG